MHEVDHVRAGAQATLVFAPELAQRLAPLERG
jgi:hypothetical protein